MTKFINLFVLGPAAGIAMIVVGAVLCLPAFAFLALLVEIAKAL